MEKTYWIPVRIVMSAILDVAVSAENENEAAEKMEGLYAESFIENDWVSEFLDLGEVDDLEILGDPIEEENDDLDLDNGSKV